VSRGNKRCWLRFYGRIFLKMAGEASYDLR
jgi:hypothetical protein